jgi:GNAT superfamily N-acetyltransferase
VIRFADAMSVVIDTLAGECGCTPADLASSGVRIFEKPDGERPSLARRYWSNGPSFAAISLGRGAVISAAAPLMAVTRMHFDTINRDQVFEPGRLAALDASLRPYGLQLYGPYPRLVCGVDTLCQRAPPAGFSVSVRAEPPEEQIESLGPDRWPNAISARRSVSTAAVALATHGAEIVGVAATSKDTDRLWQIGIDVLEAHRGLGLGAALTSALAAHILEHGGIAFYGTAPANLPSINTAIAAGFRLAWVEAFTAPAGRW